MTSGLVDVFDAVVSELTEQKLLSSESCALISTNMLLARIVPAKLVVEFSLTDGRRDCLTMAFISPVHGEFYQVPVRLPGPVVKESWTWDSASQVSQEQLRDLAQLIASFVKFWTRSI